MIFFEKKSQCQKNERGGGVLVFLASILSENIKKLKGGPFGDFFSKKSHRAENTLREYPLAPLSVLDDVKIL